VLAATCIVDVADVLTGGLYDLDGQVEMVVGNGGDIFVFVGYHVAVIVIEIVITYGVAIVEAPCLSAASATASRRLLFRPSAAP
jgi:hypothetical protein